MQRPVADRGRRKRLLSHRRAISRRSKGALAIVSTVPAELDARFSVAVRRPVISIFAGIAMLSASPRRGFSLLAASSWRRSSVIFDNECCYFASCFDPCVYVVASTLAIVMAGLWVLSGLLLTLSITATLSLTLPTIGVTHDAS